MKNPRISAKERGLLKGAIRRVFSRSDLRNQVLKEAVVSHTDPKRKRVKTWVQCASCGGYEAKSNVAVDHIDPVIPVNSSMEEMDFDTLVNRIWCEKNRLQILCDTCHNAKTKAENKERRVAKKEKKNVKRKNR